MEERCSKFPKIIGCRECRRPMEYEIARWREYTSSRGTQWLVWGRVELCVPMTHGPISLVHDSTAILGLLTLILPAAFSPLLVYLEARQDLTVSDLPPLVEILIVLWRLSYCSGSLPRFETRLKLHDNNCRIVYAQLTKSNYSTRYRE